MTKAWPTIAIDPPWRYDNKATRGAAEDHYDTMSLDELAKLTIPAAPDAHLYLWVTNDDHVGETVDRDGQLLPGQHRARPVRRSGPSADTPQRRRDLVRSAPGEAFG